MLAAVKVTFTVKQQDARGKDVDDWTFEVCDDAGGLGIPKIISGGSTLQATLGPAEDRRGNHGQGNGESAEGNHLPAKERVFFSNILKQAKKELRVGEEKCKKYLRTDGRSPRNYVSNER